MSVLLIITIILTLRRTAISSGALFDLRDSAAQFLYILWFLTSGPFRSQFPDKDRHAEQSGNGKLFDDPGKPLFLTPYIEKGDVETGIALYNVINSRKIQKDTIFTIYYADTKNLVFSPQLLRFC